jgi:hypothetical protein
MFRELELMTNTERKPALALHSSTTMSIITARIPPRAVVGHATTTTVALRRRRARAHRVTARGGEEDASLRELLEETHPTDPANVWDAKPPWCQPWSIVTTGTCVIAAPTQVFHATGAFGVVATGVCVAGVSAWWWVFLVAAPRAYAEDVARIRKAVRATRE